MSKFVLLFFNPFSLRGFFFLFVFFFTISFTVDAIVVHTKTLFCDPKGTSLEFLCITYMIYMKVYCFTPSLFLCIYLFLTSVAFPVDDGVTNADDHHYPGGWYHGGRRTSTDDSFHSPAGIGPSARHKRSITKRAHRRLTFQSHLISSFHNR